MLRSSLSEKKELLYGHFSRQNGVNLPRGIHYLSPRDLLAGVFAEGR